MTNSSAVTDLADFPDIDWNSKRCKSLKYVEKLLDTYGTAILYKPDKYGLFPIHWAVGANKNVEIVKLMIDSGVSPRMPTLKTANSAEPIHCAAFEGNISAIDLLVRHRIDINAIDGDGCTPLMRAAMFGSNPITKSSQTVLHLISCGADINRVDINGLNALHYAVFNGNEDTVHLLLNLGVDPNQTTNQSQPPLDFAVNSGNEYLMRLLGPLTDGVDQTDVEFLVTRYRKKSKREMLTDLLIRFARLVILFAVFSALFYAYPQYVFHYLPLSSEYLLAHICLIASNVVIWISWYKTCVSDPGYLAQDTKHYKNIVSSKAELGHITRSTGQTLTDPNQAVRLCHMCRTVQTHRSTHCRHCRRCTANFDHHCIYLSTCIGRNNRLAFFSLGLSLFTSGALSALIVTTVATEEGSILEAYHWFNLLFCLQYTFIGLVLTICNLRRAAINLTQNEEMKRWKYRHLRDSEGQFVNPFDRGSYWRNVIDYFTTTNYKYCKLNSIYNC